MFMVNMDHLKIFRYSRERTLLTEQQSLEVEFLWEESQLVNVQNVQAESGSEVRAQKFDHQSERG